LSFFSNGVFEGFVIIFNTSEEIISEKKELHRIPIDECANFIVFDGSLSLMYLPLYSFSSNIPEKRNETYSAIINDILDKKSEVWVVGVGEFDELFSLFIFKI